MKRPAARIATSGSEEYEEEGLILFEDQEATITRSPPRDGTKRKRESLLDRKIH